MNEPTDDQPMCKYGVVQPTEEELQDPKLLRKALDELKQPIKPRLPVQDDPNGLS